MGKYIILYNCPLWTSTIVVREQCLVLYIMEMCLSRDQKAFSFYYEGVHCTYSAAITKMCMNIVHHANDCANYTKYRNIVNHLVVYS